jgi:pimeloyl-ACP methyl ester carboxylesterase
MNKKTTFLVAGWKNKPMSVDIFLPPNPTGAPLLIIAHGFKGFKDWGHFPLVADMVAESGLAVATFNFSHNGTTPESLTDFADLEAFGNNNYSIELSDLNAIINALMSNQILKNAGVNVEELYLLGHSRGGGIAILTAAKDSRIKKLITWASVIEFGAFFGKDIIDFWKEQGVIYSPNARTGQQMPLYFQLYEDVINNVELQDIRKAAKNIQYPWLIVHGDDDRTVPVNVAEELHVLQPNSELLIIKNGDHNFGAKHPLAENKMPELVKLVSEKTLLFLKQ